MAWSTSALSFMLRGTDKPVIFTGAQIPLIDTHSDALERAASRGITLLNATQCLIGGVNQETYVRA